MGWIVAGNISPSFIEGNSLTGEVCAGYCLNSLKSRSDYFVTISLSVFLFCLKVWFAWLVLNMETMFEEDSQLRRCVEHELLSNPAHTPDQALKVNFHSSHTPVQLSCAATSMRTF